MKVIKVPPERFPSRVRIGMNRTMKNTLISTMVITRPQAPYA